MIIVRALKCLRSQQQKCNVSEDYFCHSEQHPLTQQPIPKGQENWLPEATIFASFQKKSSFDHCACSKLPEISAAKVQCVRRLFFVILNSTHQHNLPCQKGKKIGCWRWPYLKGLRKNPVLIVVRTLSCLKSQQQKCNVSED